MGQEPEQEPALSLERFRDPSRRGGAGAENSLRNAPDRRDRRPVRGAAFYPVGRVAVAGDEYVLERGWWPTSQLHRWGDCS